MPEQTGHTADQIALKVGLNQRSRKRIINVFALGVYRDALAMAAIPYAGIDFLRQRALFSHFILYFIPFNDAPKRKILLSYTTPAPGINARAQKDSKRNGSVFPFSAENADKAFAGMEKSASLLWKEISGNTAQMRRLAGEWIFRQMQMQIPKVYWR